MALALDASSPVAIHSSNTTKTTAPFTPPAGALLVALVTNDEGGSAPFHTLSDSSSGTWTRRAYSGVSEGTSGPGALGRAEIWTRDTATDSTDATNGITVSDAISAASQGMLKVQVWTGANVVSPVSAAASAGSSSGPAASVAITTDFSNSWVVSCGGDYSGSTIPTATSGQVVEDGDRLTGTYTSWTQRPTTVTASPSTVTIATTSPPNTIWNMVAVELRVGTAGLSIGPSSIAATFAAPRNCITNPTFEAGLTGWVAGGTVPPTLTQSAIHVHSGGFAMLITWATGGIFPQAQTDSTSTLVPGNTYTISAWAYVPTGSPAVRIAVGGVSNVGLETTVFDAFQQITMTFEATSLSHSVQIWPTSAATAGQQAWIDDVQLIPGTEAGVFGPTVTPIVSLTGVATLTPTAVAGIFAVSSPFVSLAAIVAQPNSINIVMAVQPSTTGITAGTLFGGVVTAAPFGQSEVYQLETHSKFTGNRVAWLPAVNLQFEFKLNGEEELRFDVPAHHPAIKRDNIEEGVHEVWMYRNGLLIFAGPIWSITGDASENVLHITANGLFSYFQYRVIDKSMSFKATDNNPNIAGTLIAYTQTKPFGDLGIINASTKGVNNGYTFVYNFWERTVIDEAINNLANNAATGFEFTIDPSTREFRTYQPRRGTLIPGVLEYGVNVTTYSLPRAASTVRNNNAVTGPGDGQSMLIGHAADSLSMDKYGLMEGTDSMGDAKSTLQLNERARKFTAENSMPSKVPLMTLRGLDLPFIGSYSLGDTTQVRIDNGYDQLNAVERITGYQVTVGANDQEAINVFFDMVTDLTLTGGVGASTPVIRHYGPVQYLPARTSSRIRNPVN